MGFLFVVGGRFLQTSFKTSTVPLYNLMFIIHVKQYTGKSDKNNILETFIFKCLFKSMTP